MSEDQALLSRISQLAGHINLHKGQQPIKIDEDTSIFHHAAQFGFGQGRGRARGQSRAGYRGGRARALSHGITHRNRSLILKKSDHQNNSGTDSKHPMSAIRDTTSLTPSHEDTEKAPGDSPVWVSKRDRHMQLINASIYEKETSTRSKAIERTRVQKRTDGDLKERQKINRHLTMVSNSNVASPTTATHSLDLDGLNFYVHNGGSKLARDRNVGDATRPSPKSALIGGVKFFRSKNGNLYRTGLVKAQRTHPTKKTSEPCRRFSTTGQCLLGPRCAYIHDPSKVAICRDFLRTGNCPQRPHCDLSHDPTYERVPVCLHFLRGKCAKTDCRYAHVRVNPSAQVCRTFTTLGYCSRGSQCEDRHVIECPDYSGKGECRNPKCRLPHIDRAGQLRQQGTALNGEPSKAPGEESDISSDEDAVPGPDSDDVDSDGLEDEILLGADDSSDRFLSQQDDFVQF